MFRPVYQADYYRDQDNDHDVLPLRWIPWEVYIMVRFSEPNFQPPMMPPSRSFIFWDSVGFFSYFYNKWEILIGNNTQYFWVVFQVFCREFVFARCLLLDLRQPFLLLFWLCMKRHQQTCSNFSNSSNFWICPCPNLLREKQEKKIFHQKFKIFFVSRRPCTLHK